MKITSVKKGYQAESKGLRAGDKIVLINNSPARDLIDLLSYGSQEFVRLTIHRGTYERLPVFYTSLIEDQGLTPIPDVLLKKLSA